ncbi:hypothetical protein MMC25_001908 [Agyrium rufum]|nr:hypothetical protein [Agyrium rufum]
MSSSASPTPRRADSPDPASHTTNVYDNENEWTDDTVDEDNDDIDFEGTTGDTETSNDDIEYFESLEDDDEDGIDEADYHDADDGLSGVEIELTMEDGSGNLQSINTITDDTAPQPERAAAPERTTTGAIQISREQIIQLLGRNTFARFFATNVDTTPARQTRAQAARAARAEDEEDDDETVGLASILGARARRRAQPPKSKPPVVIKPSKEGKRLLAMGIFGDNAYGPRCHGKRKPLASRLMERELGFDRMWGKNTNGLISQGLLPVSSTSTPDMVIHYDYRCYSGQFSDDGNFYYSCAQDFKVRMYDTSNPYDWKHYKTVYFPHGQWTITDSTLSPDNKWLAYSSLRTHVCLASTDPNDNSEPHYLDFANWGGRRTRGINGGHGHYGQKIYSVRFSGDGRELVAGTGDNCVMVYDLETRRTILKIPGHEDDVNAVCFGDAKSPHILYSGSDDTLIKIWDRRSLGDSREAGVFMGHTEGVTYVDSKGDGRYVLSNGKDQTMKLWDLRKMMPTEKASQLDFRRSGTGFDYRWMAYPDDEYEKHPHDCSLVSYRGHQVLKTLIRCHFSPPGSTDSRYVYSGSADGKVYIYNIDGTIAGKIDVYDSTFNTRPRDRRHGSNWGYDDDSTGAWKTCVRDASWHPNAPLIAATSWNGYSADSGSCTVHSWNDGVGDDEAEPKVGRVLDARLREDDRFRTRKSVRESRLRSNRVTATNNYDDDGW